MLVHASCIKLTVIIIHIIFCFKVPSPDHVTITSDLFSSIKPLEYPSVTLTCTVELSPTVDVPVTVNTEWTGPDGFMTTNTAQPVMESTTNYTSTTMVSSFGRDQSGNYTCKANAISSSSFLTDSFHQSGVKLITTGITLVYYNYHNVMIRLVDSV